MSRLLPLAAVALCALATACGSSSGVSIDWSRSNCGYLPGTHNLMFRVYYRNTSSSSTSFSDVLIPTWTYANGKGGGSISDERNTTGTIGANSSAGRYFWVHTQGQVVTACGAGSNYGSGSFSVSQDVPG